MIFLLLFSFVYKPANFSVMLAFNEGAGNDFDNVRGKVPHFQKK